MSDCCPKWTIYSEMFLPDMYSKQEVTALSFEHPIIFFDGQCHLCDYTVQKLLMMDKTGLFRFATLQLAKEEKITTINMDSVALLYHGQVYYKSTSAIKIIRLLGGKYKYISYIFSIIPLGIRDSFYDLIAKNRYKWFGKDEVCKIPDEADKFRFLG